MDQPDTPASRTLTLERRIDAPPHAVWRAWTEPELLKVWFTPRPWTVSRAELDVRPGGSNLVVMRSPEMYTLPLALRSLQSPVDTEWGALMAGSALATLPLLVLFAISSRQLIAGLTAGAVK